MDASPPPRIVFFDFDGTITAQDTFVRVIRQFAPEPANAVMPEILTGRRSLRAGLKEILQTIPSTLLPEMLRSVGDVPMRPGIHELLDFLDSLNVRAVVVSSGLAALIRTYLGSFAQRFAGIHAAEVETSDATLVVRSEFEAGDELVAKAEVMRRYPASQRIAIGDSITDRHMARAADVVFARDRLVDYCRSEGISCEQWADFHDVRRRLAELWSVA